MTLKQLLAAFVFHNHNLRVIHWNSVGKQFDRQHKIANELYDIVSADEDVIAEMAMRISSCVGYEEALEILKAYDGIEFKGISSETKYCYENFCEDIGIILQNLLDSIESTLYTPIIQEDHKNVGIKATLEAIYEKYDLQLRYLHKMRCDCECPKE